MESLNPRKLTYASSGIGKHHSFGNGVAQDADRHRDGPRSLQASASALADLLGGHVDVMFETLAMSRGH